MAPRLKKGIKSIAGETRPKVGTTYTYKVTAFHEGSQNVAGGSVNWVVFKKDRTGEWKRLPGLKKGIRVDFTFNQVASGHIFLIEAYLENPKITVPPGLVLEVEEGPPRLVKAEILDAAGNTFKGNAHYGQTVTLQVRTENMRGQELEIELWEADRDKAQPADLDDPLWRNGTIRVDRACGTVNQSILLGPGLLRKSGAWREGWEQEVYLLARCGTSELRSEMQTVSLKGIKTEKIPTGNGVVLVDTGDSTDAPQQENEGDGEAAQQEDKTSETTCFCLEQGRTKISCKGKGQCLSDRYCKQEAERLGIEVAVIQAIAKQESKTSSFWEPGQATILYERHVMWDQLAANLKLSKHELTQLKQDDYKLVNDSKGGYGPYSLQYKKLKKAKQIDYKCAVKSCSWGKFQVMGYHYAIAFESPEEMEQAVNTCELQQFYFFIAYLENTYGLIRAMKQKDWEDIAAKYNGRYWKTHNRDYADNLKKYYHEFTE